MTPGKIEGSETRSHLAREAQEAAMAYAGGRAAEAEEILLRAIGEPRADGASRLLWMMLFDLYRVQERWFDFDALGERFGATFGKPAPDYLPDDELPRDLPAALRRGGPGYCELSGELGEASVAQLDAIARAARAQNVVHVDASRVERLTPQGCALLSRQLQAAVSNGTGVLVSGAQRLERLLRAAVDATPKAAPCWQLLLDLHRLEGRQKAFDTTALEYALAVEVEPPQWEPLLVPVVLRRAPGERREEPRYDGPEVVHLRGDISGAKDSQLAGLRQFAQDRKYVNIDLARTTRIDPIAAAALRDTVRALSERGKVVRLLKPNGLIGTLLRALKVDEHASLIDP